MAELVVARLATAKNDVTLLENAVCLPMKQKNLFNTYLWVCAEMEFDQDQKFLGNSMYKKENQLLGWCCFSSPGSRILFFHYGSTNRREHLKNSLCN